ncbi:hypothetical protein BGZ98_004533, partial [Dissophora globulifera]
YKNLSAFLQAYADIPDKDRFFGELVRDGHACLEYYDVDWSLESIQDDTESSEQREQRMFAAFLTARNEFAPQYPVTVDQCRVLSASSGSMVSLHIIIPTYAFKNNNKHMHAFMLDFERARSAQDQGPNSGLCSHIDMSVYSKNRNIRILGSCKRNQMHRRFVRAEWHEASVNAEDAEFYITNLRPGSIEVDMPITNTLSKNRPHIRQVEQTSAAFSTQLSQIALPPHIVDSVRNRYLRYKHADQYKIHYEGGMIFKLKRECSGHCDVCKRHHTRDNAYLQLQTNGEIRLRCHRSIKKVDFRLGSLGFGLAIELCAIACKQKSSDSLIGATTYDEKYIKHELLAPTLEHLKLGNDKFEVVSKEPPSLMFLSETGTGKTEYAKALVKANPGRKFITIACRRTLAGNLGPRLGFSNYQDIREMLIEHDRVVIQAESLWRLNLDFYLNNDVILILDEISSLFDQMTSKTTMGDRHDLNNVVLKALIEGASRVICFDADLTNEDVQLVKSLRDDDVQVIHNVFKPQDGDQVILYETKAQLQVDVCDMMHGGKRVWISSTLSAKRTRAIHRDLKDKGFRGVCVTKDTSESIKRNVAENINTIIADLDYFIHTPTISVGLDCNIENHIDYVVGYFSTHCCRQMLRRVRDVKSKTYLVHVDGATSNLPTTAQTITDWICNQQNHIHGVSGLGLQYARGKGFVLPDSVYSHLYIHTRIKKHLSMNGFRSRFIMQMSEAGCVVKGVQRFADGSSGAEIKSITKKMEQIEESTASQLAKIKAEYAQQIANARDLTYETFTELNNSPMKTQDEHHAVSKYLLMEAYDITDPKVITPCFVDAFDDAKEKDVFKNICALLTDDGSTMQSKLDHVRMQLQWSVRYCNDVGLPIKALHKVLEARYIKLKYAVDIMVPCGFTLPFSEDVVSASTLKAAIETLWDSIMSDIDNICTTLGRRKPTHGKWADFKNRLSFLNCILGDILGVKIKAVDHH